MVDLIAKGDKKMQGGFVSMFMGVAYDEVRDLYEQGVNQLKMNKQWEEAANVYMFKLVSVAEKDGAAKYQLAGYYQQAGDCLKKISWAASRAPFEKAVGILQTDGKFQQAGKILKSLAEGLEEEAVGEEELGHIRDMYRRACDMFEMDDFSKSQLSACRLKLAEFAANAGQTREAIEIYEEEGKRCLQNNLLTYGAKDKFFDAGILHLLEGDAITCKLARDRYTQDDPRWAQSQEGKLYSGLVDAFEAEDEKAFVNGLAEYNEVKPLNDWQCRYLNRVRLGLSRAHANPMPAHEEHDLDLA